MDPISPSMQAGMRSTPLTPACCLLPSLRLQAPKESLVELPRLQPTGHPKRKCMLLFKSTRAMRCYATMC